MWTVLIALAAAADRPDVPEPILDLAVRDISAARSARTAFILGCAAPGVAMIGRLALAPLLETGLTAGTLGAAGVTTVGVVGMVATPLWLDSRARRSRALLDEQGLTVGRSLPMAVTATLAVASPVVLFANLTPGEDATPMTVAVALSLHAAALGVGVVQLTHNRRARLQSGWLGVQLVPTPTGVALGSTW